MLQRLLTWAASGLAALYGQLRVRLTSRVDARALLSTPTDPSALRVALENAIQGLERQRVILAQNELGEARAASLWEQRAMNAVVEGRDELARQALVNHGHYMALAETLGAELTELDADLAHYRTLLAKQ